MRKYYKMISSLTVIFPIFNEEKRLRQGIKRIQSVISKNKKIKIEIIFVNDGSKDNSKYIASKFIKSFKKRNARIKLINLKKNFGKGAALKKGILQSKSKWTLTADIDMSVSLNQVFRWFNSNLITKNNFIYFGSRELKSSKVKTKFYRRFLGLVFRFFTKLFLNINLKDTQCGYKLYYTKYAKKIFSKLKSERFEHDLEIVMLAQLQGLTVKELPVNWEHKSGSKINILLDSFKMFLGVLKIFFNYKLIK